MPRRVLPLILLCTIAAVMAALLWPRPGPASANPIGGVAAVSAGVYHTCALTGAGGVKCWGYNLYGKLGDGTTTNRSIPVDVSGLGSGVVAISAGGGETCALTTATGLKCWGFNTLGQVGDGTTSDRAAPVDVSGLTSGVAAVSAGNSHACALTTAGGVKCWGGNIYGALGDGTTTDRHTPVDVTGLTSGVGAVSAGEDHTCALTGAGGVKCWGSNGNGQLGDGTTTQRTTPVDVSGLTSGVAAISAGDNHTCALTAAGSVKCWGYNGYGQLGDGQACGAICTAPVDVSGLTSGVAAISVGAYHTCALTTAGGVKCWGYNVLGQVGDGTTTDRHTPVDVSGLTSGAAAISAGQEYTCALTTGGGVKCWGLNNNGQLGDGTTTDRHTPVDVSGLKPTPTPTYTPTATATPTATFTATPTPCVIYCITPTNTPVTLTATPTATPTGVIALVTGTPTPMITPLSVGGVSLDPQLPGSSGGDSGLLAGVIAGASAFALGGAAWYARRRRAE